MKRRCVALALGLSWLSSGCDDAPPAAPAPSSADGRPAEPAPPVTVTPTTQVVELDGMTFTTVEERETGQSPRGGVVKGPWRLSFTGDEVRWRHSDVEETFSYAVAGDGTITATNGTRTIAASYDDRERTVTWNGARYRSR